MFKFKDIRTAAAALRNKHIPDIVVLERLHPEGASINLDQLQVIFEPNTEVPDSIKISVTVRDATGKPISSVDIKIKAAYEEQPGMLGTRVCDRIREEITGIADEVMLDSFCERIKGLFQLIPNPTPYPASTPSFNQLLLSSEKLMRDSEVGSWLSSSTLPEAKNCPKTHMVNYLPQGKPRVMIAFSEVWGEDSNTLVVSLNWRSPERAFESFNIERWQAYESDEILLMVCERVQTVLKSSVSPVILEDVTTVLTKWSSIYAITTP